MAYVDGFVVPVPKKKLPAYRKLASKSAKIWKKYGALSVMESVADDVKPGKTTSFPQSVKLKNGEVVVFSLITYNTRKHSEHLNAKVLNDPSIAIIDMKTAPLDPQRMFWGGFKQLVAM